MGGLVDRPVKILPPGFENRSISPEGIHLPVLAVEANGVVGVGEGVSGEEVDRQTKQRFSVVFLVVLLMLFCRWRWKRGRDRLRLELNLPGYAQLREALMPRSERIGVQDAAPQVQSILSAAFAAALG